jgi:hypothetical protein
MICFQQKYNQLAVKKVIFSLAKEQNPHSLVLDLQKR